MPHAVCMWRRVPRASHDHALGIGNRNRVGNRNRNSYIGFHRAPIRALSGPYLGPIWALFWALFCSVDCLQHVNIRNMSTSATSPYGPILTLLEPTCYVGCRGLRCWALSLHFCLPEDCHGYHSHHRAQNRAQIGPKIRPKIEPYIGPYRAL